MEVFFRVILVGSLLAGLVKRRFFRCDPGMRANERGVRGGEDNDGFQKSPATGLSSYHEQNGAPR